MPMVGGTSHWVGPIIGALLLGTMQQIVTVTISSEINVLIVGIILILVVIIAPKGVVGLVETFTRKENA
jgi:branched-chain amino acid transport system permease protein